MSQCDDFSIKLRPVYPQQNNQSDEVLEQQKKLFNFSELSFGGNGNVIDTENDCQDEVTKAIKGIDNREIFKELNCNNIPDFGQKMTSDFGFKEEQNFVDVTLSFEENSGRIEEKHLRELRNKRLSFQQKPQTRCDKSLQSLIMTVD